MNARQREELIEKLNAVNSDAVRYLFRHAHGQDHAVKAATLGPMFNLDDRGLAAEVHAARAIGLPVCSGLPGYWWPVSNADAEPCLSRERARFRGLRESYNGLTSGLDYLFGQPSLLDSADEGRGL